MKLRKEVNELLAANVITPEIADRINAYYDSKSGTPQSKLVIVFGIFGALLISLGIILILGHNWDELPRNIKTAIAFVPLIIGQMACAFTLLKKNDSTAWKEASSSFLVISIGACIALIGQIYNLTDNMSSFMLTWMLLSIPVIYVMMSSMASLLYIAGISWYACDAGYWGGVAHESYLYWGLLLLALPYYYYLYKNRPGSNFFVFHNWIIPLSVITALGTVAHDVEELMLIAYVSLFGVLYQIGNFPTLREHKVRNNGYLVLGSVGTVIMLLILSFNFFWSELRGDTFWPEAWWTAPEFIAAAILTFLALILFIYQKLHQKPFELKPVEAVFAIFIFIFMIGTRSPLAMLLTNALVLSIGIMTIREGARQYHFGILNYGLLIVTALIICRFFDTDLGFVLKGILFVAVGIGFFLTNYWMMRKRRGEI